MTVRATRKLVRRGIFGRAQEVGDQPRRSKRFCKHETR